MKKIYRIADIPFLFEASFLPDWELFEAKNKDTCLFIVNVLSDPGDLYGLQCLELSGREMHATRINGDVMLVDKTWEHAIIFPPLDFSCFEGFVCQLVYTHAVKRRTLYFHSALIEWHGYGLMFLGPSGTGKTTQAELWERYKGACIINGDMVYVQESADEFLGWGSPWHGSSPYCENTNVPIHAMIVLKQSSENSIRELTGFEKVTAVSGSVFYPRWLENGMELCLGTLDHFLTKIPVYELSCRPDEDAVRLTEDTVFAESAGQITELLL